MSAVGKGEAVVYTWNKLEIADSMEIRNIQTGKRFYIPLQVPETNQVLVFPWVGEKIHFSSEIDRRRRFGLTLIPVELTASTCRQISG